MKFSVALASLACAAVVSAYPTDGISQCNTGTAFCCNTVGDAQSQAVKNAAGLIGASLGALTGTVGLGCIGVTGIGSGPDNKCGGSPVCCTGVSQSGLVNLGCNGIDV